MITKKKQIEELNQKIKMLEEKINLLKNEKGLNNIMLECISKITPPTKIVVEETPFLDPFKKRVIIFYELTLEELKEFEDRARVLKYKDLK